MQAGPGFWKKAPMASVVLAFMLGILLRENFEISPSLPAVLFFITLTAGNIHPARDIGFHFFKWKRWYSSLLLLSAVFLGMLAANFRDPGQQPGWYGNVKSEQELIILRIKDPLLERTNSYRTLASVEYYYDGKYIKKTKGLILLYLAKDSTINNLATGNYLVTDRIPQQVPGPSAPGGFDFNKYCRYQGIYRQIYLRTGEFHALPGSATAWENFLNRGRVIITGWLKKNIPGDKEAGLAEALLIGYKYDLDDELKQAYSNTGVVHVIAISGLHLGLIYLILVRMLAPLKRATGKKWIVPLFIIIILWGFSFLAGAQPSVLRSALMFSCIVAGEAINRKTHIINSLSFSAFLLLLYNPNWLFDAGFQLSYAAVLGIVILMKPIYNRIYTPLWIADQAWKLVAVTLAAQVFTSPFSLYHFKQFPVFFLPANLVTVPLSSGILIGEILLCVLAIFPWLAGMLGQLLRIFIYLLNEFIQILDKIPFHCWRGIEINEFQLFLLLGMVAAGTLLIIEKWKGCLWILVIFLAGFLGARSLSFIEAGNQHKFVVYHVKGATAFDLFRGRNYYSFIDSNANISSFTASGIMAFRNLSRGIHLGKMEIKAGLYQSGNKRVVVWDKNINQRELVPCDVLILKNDPRIPWKQLDRLPVQGWVVADGSNSYYGNRNWEKICDSLGIAFHSTAANGAFVLNFR